MSSFNYHPLEDTTWANPKKNCDRHHKLFEFISHINSGRNLKADLKLNLGRNLKLHPKLFSKKIFHSKTSSSAQVFSKLAI